MGFEGAAAESPHVYFEGVFTMAMLTMPSSPHPSFFERAPELAAALRTQKLENCGVVCAELEFSSGHTPPIVDAHLLLGSQLDDNKRAAALLGR